MAAWWRLQLIWVMVLLGWLGQGGWLLWHFAPETKDLIQRLATGTGGEAVRAEDPVAREAKLLACLIPPTATYLYLDHYESGRYLPLRYLLHPRRQVRLDPSLTPSRLYAELQRHQAEFVVLAADTTYPWLDFLFGATPGPFERLWEAAPAVVFRVRLEQVRHPFYD